MTPNAPIYTLRLAFEAAPLCSCFGIDGLLATVPQLEPNLYQILIDHGAVGAAARQESGNWWIDMVDGLKAEPGQYIV